MLCIGSLDAKEAPTLSKDQAIEIACLVLRSELSNQNPATSAQYEPNAGVWRCKTSSGVVDGEMIVEVRDQDRYYRTLLDYGINPKSNNFRMSSKLRKQIAKIAPQKKKS